MTPPFDFGKLDPADGYRVIEVDKLDLSLHLAMYGGGELVPINPDDPTAEQTIEIARWASPVSPTARGECNRLRLLLEAFCRYFSTGGQWRSADMAINQLEKHIRPLAFPGFHYLEGVFNTNMHCEHLFVSDTDQGEDTAAVLWVEDEFIDPKTLAQIRQEQIDEEGGPSVRRVSVSDGLELPDSADPQTPQLPPGGSAG